MSCLLLVTTHVCSSLYLLYPCSGRINYYTLPPEQTTHHVTAEIVNNWGKAFDMVDYVLYEFFQINNHLLSFLAYNC